MLLGLFVILVALQAGQIFFAGISILGRFLAQLGSPGFPGFSFSLSFFLVHPYGLGGGISLSPVNPLDYVKKRLVNIRWKFFQKF